MSTSSATPETVDAREADSDSDSESDSRPETYPTYEDLRSDDVVPYPTLAAVRLVWYFSGGSPETSLSVMATAYDIDVLEPYYQPTAGGGWLPWHVISKSPLTHPPVSAITVKVDALEIWESYWKDFHRNHSDPDSYNESEDLQYGDLPNYDPEKDERPPHLLVCCGSDRPRQKAGGVLVTASPSGPGFVTVHDYVTTMHPWLMRNRNDILDAMDVFENLPDLEDMDLVVDLVQPNWLMIREKSEWVVDLSMRRQNWASIHALETSAE
ncbi:hypothetical protein VF21_06411 [Pseudogymnoascus sp. 05NY08]|nr:hypothetical protein VF21_06411 [Pseudogymnoascus sp. 05NY08]